MADFSNPPLKGTLYPLSLPTLIYLDWGVHMYGLPFFSFNYEEIINDTACIAFDIFPSHFYMHWCNYGCQDFHTSSYKTVYHSNTHRDKFAPGALPPSHRQTLPAHSATVFVLPRLLAQISKRF